jgi:predicted small lipoprotein YifL
MKCLALCCLCLALAGCGQRGALYLPDEPPAEAEAAPQAAETEENTKTKKK